MNDTIISRRLVDVRGRKVHLRQAGSGPRLLLIHGSPANSEYNVPLIKELAGVYCCIAPDSPGFGDSEPLPPGASSIGSLALATAELLEVLQCAPCLVMGSHTGAGIALELAAQRPDLVSGVVLDGVPIFTAAEQQQMFQGYFETLQVDERGGHYARTWTRIRDMFIWFPWTTHDPANLTGTDLPPSERAQMWVSMFYQAAPHYGEVYRNAIFYGQRAIVAAATQQRPTLYLAHERDMLAPHLQRLPALKATDRVELTSAEPGHWQQAIARGLAELARTNAVTNGALHTPVDDEDRFIDVQFDAAAGQMRLRRYGSPQSPHCLLLHDAPASGVSLHSLAQAMTESHAGDVCLWVPDLPGYGDSTRLANLTPSLLDYVQALLVLLPHLGNQPLHVYGRGCGAVLALLLANHQPSAVRSLILDELPMAGPKIKAPDTRLCPPITIEADGSHWFRTWQMLRDSQIYWPWYEAKADHLLRLPGNYDGHFMHDWVRQVMQQPHTAHCLPQATCSVDIFSQLTALSVPTTLLARTGHPLAAAFPAALTSSRQLTAMTIHDAERAAIVRQRLAVGG